MAQISLGGTLVRTVGELPVIGSHAPKFTLTDGNLGPLSSEQFRGRPGCSTSFPR